MKKLLLMVLAIAILIGGPAWAEKGELRIYIWSEYMDEEKMPADFEKATGIKVKLDFFENLEEMMAKLQAGGMSQYDIVDLGDYNVPAALQLKLLQPLDHSKIPNLKNIMPKFKEYYFDPGNKYTIPYQWGTTGFMYNRSKVSDAAAQSWSILFDPKKDPGSFLLLDSTQELVAIAASYLGYKPNTTNPKELKAVIELLAATKKRKGCMGFKGGAGAKNDVVAGTAKAAIVYNGDAMRGIEEDPQKLAFSIPKEGAPMWIDLLAIPRKAPNPEAAHKWMNWLLEAKVGADLSNYNRYATPNEASLPFITKEDLKNPGIYPSKEVMEKLFWIKDPGDDMKILDQAWTRIKSQ
jgi:spermidine/putrescine transport system substrate-binding protein